MRCLLAEHFLTPASTSALVFLLFLVLFLISCMNVKKKGGESSQIRHWIILEKSGGERVVQNQRLRQHRGGPVRRAAVE